MWWNPATQVVAYWFACTSTPKQGHAQTNSHIETGLPQSWSFTLPFFSQRAGQTHVVCSCASCAEKAQPTIVNAARCPPRPSGPAERAAFVVRLQAAELVKWRFRNGQVLASLDQLMSWAKAAQESRGKGKAMHRTRSESWSQESVALRAGAVDVMGGSSAASFDNQKQGWGDSSASAQPLRPRIGAPARANGLGGLLVGLGLKLVVRHVRPAWPAGGCLNWDAGLGCWLGWA